MPNDRHTLAMGRAAGVTIEDDPCLGWFQDESYGDSQFSFTLFCKVADMIKLSSRFALVASGFTYLVCCVGLSACSAIAADPSDDKIKVLIVDGQNNHGDWPKITAMLKQYLETTDKFSVDIERSRYTWKGEDWLKDFSLDDGKKYQVVKRARTDPDFKPDFAQYDVVVNNFGYGAADWPADTQAAFTQFVNEGGGFVSVHAADNCFPNWREYNEMIGLGGWGNRNEKSGPYVYYDEKGEIVRDDSEGSGGGHGPQHEFQLAVRDTEHPITKGLPKSFLHAKDELYERLRGPAINMNILATAFASPKRKGSGRHEPTLMTIDYGLGRIFHTTLGHATYSCECVAFVTTFLRGTEWAATGEVTIEVPEDFPTADKAVSRKFAVSRNFEMAAATEAKAAQQAPQVQKLEDGFIPLFDGKTLEGWTSAHSKGEGDWGPYSVNEAEQAIHVYAGREANSKQSTDCLVSDQQFSHFILKLEYKWGENRYAPRTNWDRDAGLLFHVHGDLTKVWPFSLEMQIGESPGDKPDAKGAKGRFHSGDLFVLGRHLRTDTPRDGKFYLKDAKRRAGGGVRTHLGVEKPKGEWNEMEIRVHGSEKATFIFNGEVVLETFNFTQENKQGEKLPLSKGHIGLQAEWAELMYRNIRIKELPAE
ncbi:family 16 glycoside hydrolase [Adhaeretor mobilis]|nr:family 16 glycoside hydrolase [Adhaeretor mobilis]